MSLPNWRVQSALPLSEPVRALDEFNDVRMVTPKVSKIRDENDSLWKYLIPMASWFYLCVWRQWLRTSCLLLGYSISMWLGDEWIPCLQFVSGFSYLAVFSYNHNGICDFRGFLYNKDGILLRILQVSRVFAWWS